MSPRGPKATITLYRHDLQAMAHIVREALHSTHPAVIALVTHALQTDGPFGQSAALAAVHVVEMALLDPDVPSIRAAGGC